MQSSYVGWSKEKLLVIKKLIKLLVLGEPMPRDIFHKINTVPNLSVMLGKMLTKLPNQCVWEGNLEIGSGAGYY